ncbi:MAG TPA: RNA polymerase sigma-70 factor [Draconibacterium sp.]|jgi:RNA polymerase sigma-70 factor, ECF subfamily|nr:RNA polymerase sigma-70 factor [Draconibacterium sp.]
MILSEANILKKLKEGDEDTYVMLFREYYVPLCNYSRRYLGRKDLAEDIVSETFFNIWTKREKIDIRTSLKSYLFQAVCKNSLYYLRKAKKEEMLEDYLVKHPTDNMGMDKFTADSPSDFLLMKDLSEKIQAGIDRLPPQQQTTFKLKRYEGKKNREIAEIMGLSVKTVEMHLAKAMLSLRTYLKDYIPEFLILLILKDII